MLFRNDLLGSVKPEEIQQIGRMLQKAIRLRGMMPGMLLWSTFPRKKWFAPVCHEIAHGFAEVFGGKAVDGEHLFLVEAHQTETGDHIEADFSTILHSWVEIETSLGNRFILDIYPDRNGAILPVLLRAPNPAYWIPRDERRVREFKKLQHRSFKKKVRLVAAAMREVANSPDFPV